MEQSEIVIRDILKDKAARSRFTNWARENNFNLSLKKITETIDARQCTFKITTVKYGELQNILRALETNLKMRPYGFAFLLTEAFNRFIESGLYQKKIS